jgi:ABC-type glycerol-3-phosphate transport system permease component
MRSAYLTVPREVIDAARVDGCSEFDLLRRIYVPLAMPTILTIVTIFFLWSWNDFLWPFVLLQIPEQYTIQVGMMAFVAQYDVDYGQQLAGLVIAVWLPLLVYLTFRKKIQQSLMAGAVKG